MMRQKNPSEHSLDGWDPRKEDYQSHEFNSYTSGPGRNIPKEALHGSNVAVQLYVKGIPNEMTDEGLKNLFSGAGTILNVKKLESKRPEYGDTFGFITVPNIRTAQAAIEKFDNHSIGRFRLKVSVALSAEERDKRKREKEEKDTFLQSLNTKQPVEDDRASVSSVGSERSVSASRRSHPSGSQNFTSTSSSGSGLGRSMKLFRVAGLPVAEPGVGAKSENVSSKPTPDASRTSRGIAGVQKPRSGVTQTERGLQVSQHGGPGGKSSHNRLSELQQRKQELPSSGGGDAGQPVKIPSDSGRRGVPSKHVEPRPCLSCGKIGYLQCMLCKGPYCSAICQKKDWKDHKLVCGKQKQEDSLSKTLEEQFDIVVPSPKAESQEAAASFTGRIQLSNLAKVAFVQGQTKTVEISNYTSTEDFWIQLITEQRKELDILSEKMQQNYKETSNSARQSYTPEVGELVAAHFSLDERWYRAGVKRINLDGTVHVVYLDFGNSEEIPVTRVRRIHPDFSKLPLQAIQCKLHEVKVKMDADPRPWMAQAASARRMTAESASTCEVALFTTDGKDVGEVMVKEGIADRLEKPREQATRDTPNVQSSLVAAPSGSLPASVGDGVEVGQQMEITVIHMEDPGQFFVLLKDNLTEFAELVNLLNAHYQNLPENKTFSPRVGDLVGARYNGEWFRGIVKSLDGSTAAVYFTEFGNTDPIDLSFIHPVHEQFRTQPFQAVSCGLADVKPAQGGQWSAESVTQLKSFFQESLLTAKVTSKSNSHFLLQITNPQTGDNAIDLLLKSGHASCIEDADEVQKAGELSACMFSNFPVRLLPDKCQVSVTYVESISEFFMFDTESVGELASLMSSMNAFYANGGQAVRPFVGQLVASKFSDDGSWYRASVTEMREGKALVFFIDYGNSEVVDVNDLAVLDAQFVQLPRLACSCKLTSVYSCMANGQWSKDAIDLFKAETENTVSDVSVVCRTDKHVHEVELRTMRGQSLSQILVDSGFAALTPSGHLNKPRPVGASPSQKQPNPTQSAKNPLSPKTPPITSPQSRSSPGSLKNKSPAAVLNKSPVKSRFSAKDLPVYELKCEWVQVIIVDIDSSSVFHIHEVDQTVVDKLHAVTQMLPSPNEKCKPYSPEEGELVMALSPKFSAWFRAKILNIDTGYDQVQVYYVDYGNIEWIKMDAVAAFKEELMNTPCMAVPCDLHGVMNGPWPAEVLSPFVEGCLNQVLELNPVEKTKQAYSVELKTADGDSINEQVNELIQRLGIPVTQIGAAEKSDTTKRFMSSDVVITPPPEEGEGICSHSNSPADFYISFMVQEALRNINDLYAHNNEVYTPIVGEIVVARFSMDKTWYRAEVLQMDLVSHSAHVRFIDYGNDELLSLDEIRKLDVSLQNVPAQVMRCGIAAIEGTGSSGEYSETAIEEFKIVVGQKCTIVLQGQSNGTCLVDLKLDTGMSFRDALVQAGFAVPVSDRCDSGIEENAPQSTGSSPREEISKPPAQKSSQVPVQLPTLDSLPQIQLPASVFSVSVSEAISPDEFYLQRICPDTDKLEHEMARVQDHYNALPPNPNLTVMPGNICCVKFIVDQKWYRAVIRKKLEDGQFEVQFIDYGNCEVVMLDSIQALERQLMDYPVLSLHCRLADVASTGAKWSQAALQVFAKIIVQEGLQASVVNETDKPMPVHLSLGDVNVSEALIREGHALPSGDRKKHNKTTQDGATAAPRELSSIPKVQNESSAVSPEPSNWLEEKQFYKETMAQQQRQIDELMALVKKLAK